MYCEQEYEFVCEWKKIYMSNKTMMAPSLQWRHNEGDGVSNHRRLDCLLKHLFRRRSKKTSKLRVAGWRSFVYSIVIASLSPSHLSLPPNSEDSKRHNDTDRCSHSSPAFHQCSSSDNYEVSPWLACSHWWSRSKASEQLQQRKFVKQSER